MATKTWDLDYSAEKQNISEINISLNTHYMALGFVNLFLCLLDYYLFFIHLHDRT